MRNIALGLLMVILLSILVEPMVEIANVTREKIVLGAALSNALRASKDRSLRYDNMRSLDAIIDRERFKDYFAEAWSSAIKATLASRTGDTMVFAPDNGKANEYIVTLDFAERTDAVTGQVVAEVKVKAETVYKFKTKYLKWAERAGNDVDYRLVGERKLLLTIRN
ncbi:hypothetical protein MUG84_08715 [Paenibacillus sp. KQZ6P-2]|uniref:Uncharacterized protein n=1 Tax=Paenibacillus mangrovi TaxID=2931978 RepID=A0A9X2B5A2_9BACL|nr:hypothetical protein [Paenibacillus mangrovi]MCJ8011823.1 hypothetical protein [Paenibacillus mangrovi]